ncbi:agmatinase [Anaerosolibacter carboniphilus]|uniref:Agmatinase n=1 Tax=Anaerosolibacter carboniphilus TaxID=1417629 RepID=A0A841KXE9_9FIRM|nr:agmatinase [Anaerosolibacter carboniphilus]MBB6218121.1 agmatinase [Anaerosolibacter carboniphilus]
MKKTEEMIQESNIWAGLNRPNLSMSDADIVVFGIPYDGGVSFRSGAKDAPAALREITYTIAPTTEYFEDISDLKILDIGDFAEPNREDLFARVQDKVCELVKQNKFFTMIGGDHSTTIPVQRGINDALKEPFGIIHIDAHFDLCDELEGDTFSHGSTERRALELNNVTSTDNIFFIGIRSIEMDELAFMRNHKVHVINAHDFHNLGVSQVVDIVKTQMEAFNKIYLTLDIDCLDPAYAAGTGTPQFGGLYSRDLLNLLKGLFDLPIIGFDIVEISPKLDPSLTSLFAGRKIITECWGHHHRKMNQLKSK